MKVIRVFNNNIVATKTEDNKEAIVQGSGIGFGKKPGDLLNEAKIEKRFYIMDEHASKFHALFDQVPIEYFQIAELIMEKAQNELNVILDDQIVMALTDHIYFAVERQLKNVSLTNFLNSEISYLYRKEYQIGLWALDQVETIVNVKLNKDEAGFIALHIVNASMKKDKQDISDTLVFIKGIMDIIRNSFNIELDMNDLDTTRLMTHLKFLANRVIYHENESIDALGDMYSLLINQKKQLEPCLKAIDEYVLVTFNYQLSQQEKVYLMIHLLRIFNEK